MLALTHGQLCLNQARSINNVDVDVDAFFFVLIHISDMENTELLIISVSGSQGREKGEEVA